MSYNASVKAINGPWAWGKSPWGSILAHWRDKTLDLVVFEPQETTRDTFKKKYPLWDWENPPSPFPDELQLGLDLLKVPQGWALEPQGTAFQKKVWTLVQQIPRGEVRTYADLARDLGLPGGSRAVGSAVGANSLALFIPCHRVVRSDGGLGGYRWGLERKKQILRDEGVRVP